MIECFKCGKEITGKERAIDIDEHTRKTGYLHIKCLDK